MVNVEPSWIVRVVLAAFREGRCAEWRRRVLLVDRGQLHRDIVVVTQWHGRLSRRSEVCVFGIDIMAFAVRQVAVLFVAGATNALSTLITPVGAVTLRL